MGKKTRRILGKIAIHGFEESAFMIDTVRIPFLGKRQTKLIRRLHRDSNELRMLLGKKPKKHKRVIHKGLIEEY